MFTKILNSTDKTIEAHLVMFVLVVLALVGLTVYSVVVQNQPFAPKEFGFASAAIFGGCGMAAWGQGLQRRAEGDNSLPPGGTNS